MDNKIFEKTVEKWNLPYNYDPKSPNFSIFHNLKEREVEGAKIHELHNVRVANNGIVFKYFKIFGISAVNKETAEKNNSWRFYLKYIIPRRATKKDANYILITDEWSTNYYHWFTEALQRLMILQDKVDSPILLLPEKYKRLTFSKESLRAFGIKEDQIVIIPKKSNIKIRKLFLVSCDRNKESGINAVKEKIISHFKSDLTTDFGDKIYISRSKVPIRRVINEDEVMNLLSRYGFRKVLMEDYNFLEQMSISNHAKYIVGPHGAGLTNEFFMKPDGFLLELLNRNDKKMTDYFRMSSMTKINYIYQLCKPVASEVKVMRSDNNNMDFHHGNLEVDLGILQKNVELMLKK